MIVKELIELLQKMPQGYEVRLSGWSKEVDYTPEVLLINSCGIVYL